MDILTAAISRTLAQKGAGYLTLPVGSVDGLDVSDGNAVADFLLSHEWEEVTDEAAVMGVRIGACRYFRAEISYGYVGQEGVCLLSEVSDADLPNVRIVKTQTMHLIIGSYESFPAGEVNEDTAGIVTWYPLQRHHQDLLARRAGRGRLTGLVAAR